MHIEISFWENAVETYVRCRVTEAPKNTLLLLWSPRNPQTGMRWPCLLSFVVGGSLGEIIYWLLLRKLWRTNLWLSWQQVLANFFFYCGGGVRSFPWEFGFRLDRFSGGKHEIWPCGIPIPISFSSSHRSGNRSSTSGLITPRASKARGWQN